MFRSMKDLRGTAAIMAMAMSHLSQLPSTVHIPTAKGEFARALNGKKKGQSVKQQARKAFKRRAIKRARRLGHA